MEKNLNPTSSGLLPNLFVDPIFFFLHTSSNFQRKPSNLLLFPASLFFPLSCPFHNQLPVPPFLITFLVFFSHLSRCHIYVFLYLFLKINNTHTPNSF